LGKLTCVGIEAASSARTIRGVFSSWFASTKSGASATISATRASLVPPTHATRSTTPRGSTQ
jgi:hypothetical protein